VKDALAAGAAGAVEGTPVTPGTTGSTSARPGLRRTVNGIGAGLAWLTAIAIAGFWICLIAARRHAAPPAEPRAGVPASLPSPAAPAAPAASGARPPRFFSAAVIAGRLHVLGLARGGPWNPEHLEWRTEPDVDRLVNPNAGDRKITARADLARIGSADAAERPARFLWIREDLLEEARRLWA
jgi:hypothetical protein